MRVRQAELDDWHRDLGSMYRQGEGEDARRLTTDSGVLGADRRVDDTEADLRGVVEQLRVLDLPGEIGQVEVLERPAETVNVQPVAALGDGTSVGGLNGWRSLRRSIGRAGPYRPPFISHSWRAPRAYKPQCTNRPKRSWVNQSSSGMG